MLEYVTPGDGPDLGLIVHHTDATREWAYDRDSHVGTLARALDAAPERGLAAHRHGEGLEGHLPVRECSSVQGRRAALTTVAKMRRCRSKSARIAELQLRAAPCRQPVPDDRAPTRASTPTSPTSPGSRPAPAASTSSPASRSAAPSPAAAPPACAAAASSSRRSAPTCPATTSAPSTGRSPPAPAPRTSASPARSATARRCSSSTSARRCSSAPCLNMKSVTAAEIAALAAWRILGAGDRVGGLVLSDAGLAAVPARRSRAAVLRLLDARRRPQRSPSPPTRRSSPTPPPASTPRSPRPRSIVTHDWLLLVVSDFDGADDATLAHPRPASPAATTSSSPSSTTPRPARPRATAASSSATAACRSSSTSPTPASAATSPRVGGDRLKRLARLAGAPRRRDPAGQRRRADRPAAPAPLRRRRRGGGA